MVPRVSIDVGGQIFKISTRALENGPSSKLTKLYKSGARTSDSIYIEVDRPADLFAPVLALYQTGELHFPSSSCPGAFLNELEFWEISPEVTENCCFNRIQSFLNEQNTLKKFQESRAVETEAPEISGQYLKSFLGKVWSIVDFSKPSFFARIYFVLSLSMILLSIFTLALSTDPYFRRKMTNCERLEYMESSGMEKVELAKKWLPHYCQDKAMPHRPPPGAPPSPDPEVQCSSMNSNWYKKVYLPHRGYESDHDEEKGDIELDELKDNSLKSALFNKSEENKPPEPNSTPDADGEYVELPDFEIPVYTFAVLEAVTVVYFTIDLLLRLITCPCKKRYILGVINFTDALALVCTYAHFILMYIYKHERYRDNWIDLLKYTQVLRSLRFFRTITNVRAGQVLAYTLRANLKDLSILILFLIAGMSIFASCLFFAEERQDFRSIPVGWYWAIVSMTTVGYGDIAPKTAFGRVLACICTVSGIVLLALTVPIFANNFLILYNLADSEKAVKKLETRKLKQQKSAKPAHVQDAFRSKSFLAADVKCF